ncbi:MAG: hypothetical protein ICV59_03070 [Thermoleophilia bacterium]|nr:hypothetical protein [Thermoleophilia bacterium]
MRAERRFSQAIAEGDGISLIAQVADAAAAGAAEHDGAEGVTIETAVPGVREATRLPILWRGLGAPSDAGMAGADACVLAVAEGGDEPGRLEERRAEVTELGLECAVEVRDEEELQLVLDRLDPEIFVLSSHGGASLESVLSLLSDVPAGKLVVAEAGMLGREDLDELERAGVDAVILPGTALGGLRGSAA